VDKSHPSPCWSSTKDMLPVTKSPSIKAWSHHQGSRQVDEDLSKKAMLPTSCSSHLDNVSTMELPTKEGSSHPPNMVIVTSPHQAGGDDFPASHQDSMEPQTVADLAVGREGPELPYRRDSHRAPLKHPLLICEGRRRRGVG